MGYYPLASKRGMAIPATVCPVMPGKGVSFLKTTVLCSIMAFLNINTSHASSTKMMLSNAMASRLVTINGKANTNSYNQKGLHLR